MARKQRTREYWRRQNLNLVHARPAPAAVVELMREAERRGIPVSRLAAQIIEERYAPASERIP